MSQSPDELLKKLEKEISGVFSNNGFPKDSLKQLLENRSVIGSDGTKITLTSDNKMSIVYPEKKNEDEKESFPKVPTSAELKSRIQEKKRQLAGKDEDSGTSYTPPGSKGS
ncbi:hypothetical protein AB6T85_19930 [Erwinia sp. ACCC 02193]|jgi:hypothetical protein|uniref:Uncharacterized protein n=1 Tax=Erwinia aeris TaxID=3239803 RepID=A0ABV4ED31_9GAMM